jgi:hypothetical protein
MLDRPAGPRLPTTAEARARLAVRLGPLGPGCRLREIGPRRWRATSYPDAPQAAD